MSEREVDGREKVLLDSVKKDFGGEVPGSNMGHEEQVERWASAEEATKGGGGKLVCYAKDPLARKLRQGRYALLWCEVGR